MRRAEKHYTKELISVRPRAIVLAHDSYQEIYFTCSFLFESYGDGGMYILPFIVYENKEKRAQTDIRRYRSSMPAYRERFSIIAGCKTGTPPKLSKNLRDFIDDIDPSVEARLDVQLMLEKEFSIPTNNANTPPYESNAAAPLKLEYYLPRFFDEKEYTLIGWVDGKPIKNDFKIKNNLFTPIFHTSASMRVEDVKQWVKEFKMLVVPDTKNYSNTEENGSVLSTLKKYILFKYTKNEVDALLEKIWREEPDTHDALEEELKNRSKHLVPFILLQKIMKMSVIRDRVFTYEPAASPLTFLEYEKVPPTLREFYNIYVFDKEIQQIYGITLSDILEMKRNGASPQEYDFVVDYVNVVLSRYVFHTDISQFSASDVAKHQWLKDFKLGEKLYKDGTGIPDISSIVDLYTDIENFNVAKKATKSETGSSIFNMTYQYLKGNTLSLIDHNTFLEFKSDYRLY